MTLPKTLLSRIEDAGLNASAPPQQRWMDGWLLRFSPGKARRARCINAVAAGRIPWQDKLHVATAFYAEQALQLAVRITPFTAPADLDAGLAALGLKAVDSTRVMVQTELHRTGPTRPERQGYRYLSVGAVEFADAVGVLRDSPAGQRAAHAERLLHAPVQSQKLVVRQESDGAVVACGQSTSEQEFVGLYDIHTREDRRGIGIATDLCERLLAESAKNGGKVGYLQVDAANHSARRIYTRMGFADAYSYHYRQQG